MIREFLLLQKHPFSDSSEVSGSISFSDGLMLSHNRVIWMLDNPKSDLFNALFVVILVFILADLSRKNLETLILW